MIIATAVYYKNYRDLTKREIDAYRNALRRITNLRVNNKE
jgi:hypothetical protein